MYTHRQCTQSIHPHIHISALLYLLDGECHHPVVISHCCTVYKMTAARMTDPRTVLKMESSGNGEACQSHDASFPAPPKQHFSAYHAYKLQHCLNTFPLVRSKFYQLRSSVDKGIKLHVLMKASNFVNQNASLDLIFTHPTQVGTALIKNCLGLFVCCFMP